MRLLTCLLGLALLSTPPPDYDRDGVPDVEDDCPTDPGDAAHKGCPGEPEVVPAEPPPPPPPKVEVRADRIDLDEPIFFETGSARIDKKSDRLVQEIAAAVRGLAPGTVVSVEGHTDARGRRRSNVRLSKARAEAVVRTLVTLGVPAARLRSVGHGPDRPIADNRTRAGRAKNRRVELLIKP